MHRLRRDIVRKLSGYAALFAILLLSFAPLASQAIAHARDDATFASLCASAASPHGKTQADDHHLQVCGYCDLATHASAPPAFVRHDTGIAPWRETFIDAHDSDAPLNAARMHAQPRAPPALA